MTKFICYSILGALVASAWWSVPRFQAVGMKEPYAIAIIATLLFAAVFALNAMKCWDDE